MPGCLLDEGLEYMSASIHTFVLMAYLRLPSYCELAIRARAGYVICMRGDKQTDIIRR